jgi:hypothetical protein
MRLVPLLGKSLKDHEIIDILESLKMDVIYDFDRLHEGQPDKYWAASKEAGLQLGFDQAQNLTTVFLYLKPRDGFARFSVQDCDAPIFASLAAAEEFALAQNLQITKGKSALLGLSRDWVRLGFGTYSIHYEFHGKDLALVTLSQKKIDS